MNNSNVIKNNLIQNNQNRCHNTNPIDELKHKGSLINYNKVVNSNLKDNFIDIKTKLLLIGDLFSKDTIEINKYGIKNGLRQKKDSLSVFGIKEKNNGSHNSNTNNCDYYFDMEKFDENNSSIGGKVFEIFINKKNKTYTLYFLHNSLILYYKINNNVFFDMEKDYYLILGDIFLTIIVKKKTDTKEKTINIQTEIENEKPNKYTFEPKDMPIRIGRVNCHINIPRPSISKLHSVIDFLDDEFFYKDCGSTNGSTLLAVQLLCQEIQLAADRLFFLDELAVLLDVAVQPRQFLIDAAAVRKQCHFRLETAFVNLLRFRFVEILIHPLVEPCLVALDNARRDLLDLNDMLLQLIQLALEIKLERLALSQAHRIKIIDRQIQRLRQDHLDLLKILLGHLRLHDTGQVQHLAQRQIIRQTDVFRGLSKRADVFGKLCLIDPDCSLIIGMVGIADRNVRLAARDPLLHNGADRRLQRLELMRHPNVRLKVAVIHRFDLDSKLTAKLLTFASAKSGHAFHAILHIPSWFARVIIMRYERTGTHSRYPKNFTMSRLE